MYANKRNTKTALPKPFCKVCYDAKRPASEYESHYVRETPNPNSKIICPIILNTVCHKCGKKGHVKSSCNVKVHNKTEPRPTQEQHRTNTTKKPVNSFQVLEEEDDEEIVEINKQVLKEEATPPPANPSVPSYADIIKKEKMETKTAKVANSRFKSISDYVEYEECERQEKLRLFSRIDLRTVNWAEVESDDDF